MSKTSMHKTAMHKTSMHRTYTKKGLSRETLMQFSRQRVGLADNSLLTEVELKYVENGTFCVRVNHYLQGSSQQEVRLVTKSLTDARAAWKDAVDELFGEKMKSARSSKMFSVIYAPFKIGSIELAPWRILQLSPRQLIPVRCETAEEAWLEVCWKMKWGVDKDALKTGGEND